MFRVRFNRQHVEGYRPALEVERVQKKLESLLKRHKLVLDHTDGAGFEYYRQIAQRKPYKPKRPTIRVCSRKPAKCPWVVRDSTQIWPNNSIRCNQLSTVFTEVGDYCERHGDKAIRREAYFQAKYAQEEARA